MNTCNTCKSETPCIWVPKNASTWNTPNFDGCELWSLPPGICEGYDCIEKVPACSIEWGHILKLIKLSNYIDLDKIAGVNFDGFQEKLDNSCVLSQITKLPVLDIKDGINTVAHQHCDGTYQIDLVTSIPLTETKKVSYCDASGYEFLVTSGQVNQDSIQVFNGVLIKNYDVIFNGVNTFIKFHDKQVDVCIDIYYQDIAPEVVTPEDCYVKVSDDDVAGFLENKISGGNGIEVTSENFWGSEYMSIALTNPIPTASPLDVNKIVYVDDNGNYQLGSPCCDRAGATLIGTDGVEWISEDYVVEFNSDSLDIIITDEDIDDGKIEVNIDIADETPLFVIENTNGSVSEEIGFGESLKFTSPDGSVGINITDGCIELTETPQTLLPINYTFTDNNERNVELGDEIVYQSDDIEITNTGNVHQFNLKDQSYGGQLLNGGVQTISAGNTSLVSFGTDYSTNNTGITTGTGLQAQESGLHDITTQVGIIFADNGNNSAQINLKVNGAIRGTDYIYWVEADQVVLRINQHLELAPGDIVTVEAIAFNEDYTINSTAYSTYVHMYRVR